MSRASNRRRGTSPEPNRASAHRGRSGQREHRARGLPGVLVPVVCAVLPGFLAGIQLSGLLFFLNPHWPFEPMPLLRVTALYAVLLGVGSALLLLPFTWRQPERARRILPWAMCLAFAAAGVAHWVHAARFSFFLPAGINRRLIKAALWLSLAAVIAFYTALLHTLQQRTYGRKSRIGFLLLALLVSYVVFERRDAFRPDSPDEPRSSTIPVADHPVLLVVGVEGLSLDVVLPLAEQGDLPFFAEILRQGSAGRLAGITPSHRIPSWYTLATGRFPFRHGLLSDRRYSAGFVEPGLEFQLIPVGLGFRRWGIPGGELPGVATPTKGALALWEMTAGLGIDTAVLNWPGARLEGQPAVVAKGSLLAAETVDADPTALPEIPAVLRNSPLGDQVSFANDVLAIERASDWLDQQAAADSLSASASVDAPSTDASDRTGTAVFVAIDGLSSVSRETFGAYAAVQFEGILGDDRVAAADRLRAYYQALDGLLRDLWRNVTADKWMVIVSPYGMRPREWLERAGSLIRPSREFDGKTSGAPDGSFLAYGTAVEPGRFLSRLEITDVAPTILYGNLLPAARDLDGRVRTEVFRESWLEQHPLTFVPSYEAPLEAPPE